jgi:hypothetical protein
LAGRDKRYRMEQESLYHLALSRYHEVFNEVDWKAVAPQFAYRQVAQSLCSVAPSSCLQLFEVTSESFWDQVCSYIKIRFDYQNATDPKDSSISKYYRKFKIADSFFSAMTIEQLDKVNKKLTALGVNIKEKKAYVLAYFSKQFSDELSQEYQEGLTNEEKFRNLESMYQYAKSSNLHKGLISSLLEQMLKLSLKLDVFREDLFKEYIERPTEVNHHLKDEEVRRKNQKGSYKLQKWN